MSPPASSAPSWAAESIPSAIPLTTGTPETASSCPRARADLEPVRRGPARADERDGPLFRDHLQQAGIPEKPEGGDRVGAAQQAGREALRVRAGARQPGCRGRVTRRRGIEALALGVDHAALRAADRLDQLVVVQREHRGQAAMLVEGPGDPGNKRAEQRAPPDACGRTRSHGRREEVGRQVLAVGDGLGHVAARDHVAAVEVGDGPRHPQDPVVAADTQAQAFVGGEQGGPRSGLERTEQAQLRRPEVPIAACRGPGKPRELPVSGGAHPRAHRG